MTDIPDDMTGARATVGEGELAALTELAAKATPGPWAQEPDTLAGRVWVRMAHHSDLEPNTMPAVEVMQKQWDWRRLFEVRSHRDRYRITREDVYKQREADAAFIAAADPPTVLALIAALKEARFKADVQAGSLTQASRELDEARTDLAAVTAERDRLAGVIARVEGLCDEADSRRGTAQFFGNVQTGTLRRVLDDALTTTSEGNNRG